MSHRDKDEATACTTPSCRRGRRATASSTGTLAVAARNVVAQAIGCRAKRAHDCGVIRRALVTHLRREPRAAHSVVSNACSSNGVAHMHWVALCTLTWQPRSDLGAFGSHTCGTTYFRQQRPELSTQITVTGRPMLAASTRWMSRRCRASPNESNASPTANPADPAGVAGDGCCVTRPKGLRPCGAETSSASGCCIPLILDHGNDGHNTDSPLTYSAYLQCLVQRSRLPVYVYSVALYGFTAYSCLLVPGTTVEVLYTVSTHR